MLAGRPARAFDQVATAGGGAALVVDVARAMAGGAVRQPFQVADVFLGHGVLHSWMRASSFSIRKVASVALRRRS